MVVIMIDSGGGDSDDGGSRFNCNNEDDGCDSD